jgi:hypothetical protein
MWNRKTRLLVSPSTYDELAGMVAPDDEGELDMTGVALVRGEEPLAADDPLAAHRAKVLAPKVPQ